MVTKKEIVDRVSLGKVILSMVKKGKAQSEILAYAKCVYKDRGTKKDVAWVEEKVTYYIRDAYKVIHPPVSLRFSMAEWVAAGNSDKVVSTKAYKIYEQRGWIRTEKQITRQTALYLKEAHAFVDAVKAGLAKKKAK